MMSLSLKQAMILLVTICCCTKIDCFSPSISTSNPLIAKGQRNASILPVTALSLSSTTNNSNSIMETISLDFVVEKPMGIILQEREDNEKAGVYCIIDDSLDYSSAFLAGIRTGDVLASLEGNDVTSSSFDEVMDLFANSWSPVSVTVLRQQEKQKKEVVIQPKRMPSTKKLMKASTSVNFWKDPLMIGSAIFTVVLPLGIYLAASGPK